MSHGQCPLCEIVSALARSEVYRSAAGSAYRKVADLPASVAVLGDDQFYRGYTLVIARTHARELYELAEPEAAQYFRDMVGVARAIAIAFRPAKMNYELLGNTVAHLHWHLFPRYPGDPDPQRPVWEKPHAPVLAAEPDAAATIAAIRRQLPAPGA